MSRESMRTGRLSRLGSFSKGDLGAALVHPSFIGDGSRSLVITVERKDSRKSHFQAWKNSRGSDCTAAVDARGGKKRGQNGFYIDFRFFRLLLYEEQ